MRTILTALKQIRLLSNGINTAGIGYSDDKMLQTRIFSYADTQRYRLGPNYLMLPVNAPKNVHHNNHHDGVMNFMHRDEEVSSFTNLLLYSYHAYLPCALCALAMRYPSVASVR